MNTKYVTVMLVNCSYPDLAHVPVIDTWASDGMYNIHLVGPQGENRTIRFPLTALKFVTEDAIEPLDAVREGGHRD